MFVSFHSHLSSSLQSASCHLRAESRNPWLEGISGQNISLQTMVVTFALSCSFYFIIRDFYCCIIFQILYFQLLRQICSYCVVLHFISILFDYFSGNDIVQFLLSKYLFVRCCLLLFYIVSHLVCKYLEISLVHSSQLIYSCCGKILQYACLCVYSFQSASWFDYYNTYLKFSLYNVHSFCSYIVSYLLHICLVCNLLQKSEQSRKE